MIIIGLDDTDNLESRGTGHLARQIASELALDFPVIGVTRHQLLVDQRVPCTKNNSCAAIALAGDGEVDLNGLFGRVRGIMLADFQTGSDPGLCVASTVPAAITDFGFQVKRKLVKQQQALQLAAENGMLLQGLGGTQDGVIGALAAVGLAACGEDGRYIYVGHVRDLSGLQSVQTVIEAGVTSVRTLDGTPVTDGMLMVDKLRPARRGGQPVAVVNWDGDHWQPVKLD
jgi:tRNA(Ile2) C34 agmatinyltransferase TiaS